MSAVYSSRLFSEHVAGFPMLAGPFDDFVCVVRDIDVYASTEAGTSITLESAETGVTFAFFSFGAGAQGTQLWRGRQVIPAGDAIEINVSGDEADVTISGYLLSA